MLNLKSDDIVTICGKRGSGKSYLLKKIINSTQKYVVYDLKHEHIAPGAIIISDLAQLSIALQNNKEKIIFRPRIVSIEEFDWICNAVYIVGNRMLFVDEADRVMPNNAISKNASNFIDLGRSRHTGGVYVLEELQL